MSHSRHDCPWCQCPPLTQGWRYTARGKLICPTCGATGWPVEHVKGTWLEAHASHKTCIECGKVTTARGFKRHAHIHERTRS